MAILGVSYLSFSWPYEQAKCLDTQFYPMERDRLGQACCCCELAPSVSEEVFQQSSEDLLAQLSCAAGQFPSTARALVSQLEQQLTLLMLHQRRPGSLSFYQVVFSKNAQLEGWGARCWDAGCSSPRWRQGWWQGWWQGWVRLLWRHLSCSQGQWLGSECAQHSWLSRCKAWSPGLCVPCSSRNAEHAAAPAWSQGLASSPPERGKRKTWLQAQPAVRRAIWAETRGAGLH